MHDIFVGLMGRRNSESGECNGGSLKKKKKTPETFEVPLFRPERRIRMELVNFYSVSSHR